MAVDKNISGKWITLEGTVAEVRAALDAERVSPHQVANVYYDGDQTKTVAFYHK